jgi:hypothetical protein
MKLVLLFVVLSILGAGLGFTYQNEPQIDPQKAAVQKARREARYSDPQRLREGKRISSYPPNTRVGGSLPPMPFFPNEADAIAMKNTERDKRNNLACSADVIVRGSITDSKGFVTADDSSIYSVYKFQISSVLRGSVPAKIEVTGPGGIAKIDGKQIIYEPLGEVILQSKIDYILYLKHDRESGDYMLTGFHGAFLVFEAGIARADVRNNKAQAAANLRNGVPQTLAELQSEISAVNCK